MYLDRYGTLPYLLNLHLRSVTMAVFLLLLKGVYIEEMYGDKGVELVKEALRAGDSLAPFNEDAVRFVLGGYPPTT